MTLEKNIEDKREHAKETRIKLSTTYEPTAAVLALSYLSTITVSEMQSVQNAVMW